MPSRISVRPQRLSINGAELYCEVRGSGPAVLFSAPATGDAGTLDKAANELADDFTVITYDRRGNSRSPKPADWTSTSVSEQAEDAAGIIQVLGVRPAALFGLSAGGTISLELEMRHPGLTCGAVLYEPIVGFLLEKVDRQRRLALRQQTASDEMRANRSQSTMERGIRAAVGDRAWEAIAPDVRERILGNAGVFYFIEMDAWSRYRPDEMALRKIHHPLYILRSDASEPAYAAMCGWLAERVPTAISIIAPGLHTHAVNYENPRRLAAVLRPYLKKLTQK